LEEENKEKIFELIQQMKKKEELKLTRELLEIQEEEKNRFNKQLAFRREEWVKEEEEEEKIFCDRIKKINNNISELMNQEKKREEMYRQQLEIMNIDKHNPEDQQDPEKETIGISADLSAKIRSHQAVNQQLLADIENQRDKLSAHKQMLEDELHQLIEVYDKRKVEIEKEKLSLEEDMTRYQDAVEKEITELASIIKAHCVNARKAYTSSTTNKTDGRNIKDDDISYSPKLRISGKLINKDKAINFAFNI